MKRLKRSFAALLIVAPALIGTALAQTLRCGSQLISVGDRAFEVQQKCGEPRFRDLVGYNLGPNERRESPVEEWVYGPDNGMLRILTFEGSRLIRIESQRDR